MKFIGRWRVFAFHSALSLMVFILLAAIVLFWIFPDGLFWAAGGWEGLRIILAVDLVLGPFLTLIVFNKLKSRVELLRDLAMVATVQVLALIAGCYVVMSARPLTVVHVFDTLYVFNREDYRQLGVAQQDIDRFTGWGPTFYYVEVPSNIADFLSQHAKALMNGERQLQQRVDLYRKIPAESQGVEWRLRESDGGKGSCKRIDIESSYLHGSVCFDPEMKRVWGFSVESASRGGGN